MKKQHFLHVTFSPNFLWQWLVAFALTASFSAVLVTSCKKQGDDLSPAMTTFEQLAKDFVAKAALPLGLTALNVDDEVPQDSLAQMARRVIAEMAFLEIDPVTGKVLAHKIKDAGLPSATLDGYTAGFLSDSLILAGDHLIQFHWKTTTGQEFTTLGTAGPDGTPRFEPILHFNGIEMIENKAATYRDWTWGPWKRTIQNGFGCNCVEVEWTVKIATSPDGCNIVDPGPHVEITKQVSNCWLWEQQTTKGEILWCNPEQECQCSVQPSAYGEDCIKWAVVTYVATGASEIEVEAGAGAEYKGIKLESKVSFDAGRCGSEATYETIRSLCAKSGSK